MDNYPTNTPTELYLSQDTSLPDLLERIHEHFGLDDLSKFVLTPEYHHVRCIGYDLYDPFDYECYIVVRKV